MHKLTAKLPARCLRSFALLLAVASAQLACLPIAGAQPLAECEPIQRLLPPEGLAPPAQQAQQWQSRIENLQQTLPALPAATRADVSCLVKACRLAIEHREFYSERDFKKLDRILTLAESRAAELEQGRAPWTASSGLQVRGFQSQVDGSAQPLGLVLPEDWQQQERSLPLYVWLHGRGNKTTDLHFLCERLDKTGQIKPAGAIVVHPFGRQCVGYKSAGETDVMEAIDFVCDNYPVDQDRIVLMGFSMGGAGVWHLAAHYSQRFVAASSGAGFAETAQYQRLKPEDYPPKYEQILWSIYDVPGYTRNLFNIPFVAYSGELDKQIQAARVMEAAYAAEGRRLPHLIGPGMGHKYHPDTLAQIMDRMHQAVVAGPPSSPTQIFIQTQHPRYGSRDGITIDGLQQQYSDTRIDAVKTEQGWKLTTQNVKRMVLQPSSPILTTGPIELDGQPLQLSSSEPIRLSLRADRWEKAPSFPKLRKHPGLSGPIDDAFIDRFMVVLPSGSSPSKSVDRWVRCEAENLRTRWKALFRGELRLKRDAEVTAEDMTRFHLVLWGTPASNSLIAKVTAAGQRQDWPFQWTDSQVSVGQNRVDAANCVLQAIYPNPLADNRYVVFNSGPTFRQAHDRTNSLQNPHLPDWVLLSLDSPPNAELPGRVVHTGFFDDAWQPDGELTW